MRPWATRRRDRFGKDFRPARLAVRQGVPQRGRALCFGLWMAVGHRSVAAGGGSGCSANPAVMDDLFAWSLQTQGEQCRVVLLPAEVGYVMALPTRGYP